MEVSVLLELLESIGLTVSEKDVRSSILDTSGNFSCKSIRNYISYDSFAHNFDPAIFIWKSKVPPKIKILGWLVMRKPLNTCEILQ